MIGLRLTWWTGLIQKSLSGSSKTCTGGVPDFSTLLSLTRVSLSWLEGRVRARYSRSSLRECTILLRREFGEGRFWGVFCLVWLGKGLVCAFAVFKVQNIGRVRSFLWVKKNLGLVFQPTLVTTSPIMTQSAIILRAPPNITNPFLIWSESGFLNVTWDEKLN